MNNHGTKCELKSNSFAWIDNDAKLSDYTEPDCQEKLKCNSVIWMHSKN